MHVVKTLLAATMMVMFVSACSAANRGDCAVSYAKSGYAVDPKTKRTFFKDTVVESTSGADGVVVAFKKSARRYRIPPGADPALGIAANRSLMDGTPVHVAVDDSASATAKTPGDAGPLPTIFWLNAERQDPGCAD